MGINNFENRIWNVWPIFPSIVEAEFIQAFVDNLDNEQYQLFLDPNDLVAVN